MITPHVTEVLPAFGVYRGAALLFVGESLPAAERHAQERPPTRTRVSSVASRA